MNIADQLTDTLDRLLVALKHHNNDGELPVFLHPVKCDLCGHICEAADVLSRREGFDDVCPYCERLTDFQPVYACNECDCYPCKCKEAQA